MNLHEYAHKYRDMVPHVDTLTHFARTSPDIVELGVRGGVSTWAFLDGLPDDGRLVSVDIEDVTKLVPKRVSQDPRWRLIVGNDQRKSIQRLLPSTDLVFIDTSHEYHHTAAELLLAQRLEATRIVLHDWNLPDVMDAALGFCHRTGFRLEHVEDSHWGLAVLAR